MAERIFIDELIPITDIQDGAKILVDQNGYKKMLYSDFVIDISNTMKSEQNLGWNATLLDGTPIGIELPQDGEVIRYDTGTGEFTNTILDAQDINWSTIPVNEYKFLQVGSNGVVEQEHVTIPSLRMDNETSGGYFLRVKSATNVTQIEAVPFDPNEFTINAQTLQGQTISDLDNKYLESTNNLQDLSNLASARTTLDVFSKTESDNRYAIQTNNLSDLSNAVTSFDNIKQSSTTSYAGVIEIGTSPEVQDGIRTDVAVVPSTLKDNYYNKAVSDGRFLSIADNLSDVSNLTAARSNLNVYSTSDSDNRYLQKGLNLSELTSKSLARDNLEVYDKNYIDALESNLNSVETGTILTYPVATPPTGYIKCNGALLNENAYPELFAVIGRTYGGASANSTFKVPDLRGEFVRGWDDGRGVDVGRAIGTSQNEDFKSHSHGASSSVVGDHTHGGVTSGGPGNVSGRWDATGIGNNNTPQTDPAGSHNHTITVNATGGSETRPRNVALMYIIKF